jgi:hypothetical protein
MPAKKSPTSLLRLSSTVEAPAAPVLPSAFGKALGALPQQLGDGSAMLAGRHGGNVMTDQSARGVKPGVHVTKPEIPRSGHR